MRFLILFWLACWAFQEWHPLPNPPPSRGRDIIIGPFTTAQKILLGYPLNPNEFSLTDWELLPGIGPSVAKKIVAFRKEEGGIADLESLTAVKGIGPKTVERLRQFFDTPKR